MAKPPNKADSVPARRNGVRDVGSLMPDVGGVAFRRFGFVQGALLSRWRDVVGPVYARWSIPESIRFPRGAKTGGTLTIRVEGPFSLQLQHVAPQIIDRANRILGHGAIARLKLVQGEVPAPADRPGAPPAPLGAPPPNLAPASLAGVADPGLRAALEDLARQLGGAESPPKVR